MNIRLRFGIHVPLLLISFLALDGNSIILKKALGRHYFYSSNSKGIVNRCVQNGTISLTFDDGPVQKKTEALIKILNSKKVTATFFVVGKHINNSTKMALRTMQKYGHTIGHHSWSHKYPGLFNIEPEVLLGEMNRLTESLEQIIGIMPTVMRPPYGRVDDQLIRVVTGQLGFELICWSINTRDWKHDGNTSLGIAQYVKVLNGTNPALTPGFISLHHENVKGSRELSSQAIDLARSYGYRFVSLEECIGIKNVPQKSYPLKWETPNNWQYKTYLSVQCA